MKHSLGRPFPSTGILGQSQRLTGLRHGMRIKLLKLMLECLNGRHTDYSQVEEWWNENCSSKEHGLVISGLLNTLYSSRRTIQILDTPLR